MRRHESSRDRIPVLSRASNKWTRSLPERRDDDPWEEVFLEPDEVIFNAVEHVIGRAATREDFYYLKAYVRTKGTDLGVLEREEFVDSIVELLMSDMCRESTEVCYIVLEIINAIWYRLPITNDIDTSHFLRFELFQAVMDFLHTEEHSVVTKALYAIRNVSPVSKLIRDYLISEAEIFQFLRELLTHEQDNYDIIETAVALMQTLVSDGVDDTLYIHMKQMIPIFQHKLFTLRWPILIDHSVRVLIRFLEIPKGLDYAIDLQLHGSLSQVVMSKLDVSSECRYYAFKMICLFMERGFIRAFMNENVCTAISFDSSAGDCSPMLYAAARISWKYWPRFYEDGKHIEAMEHLCNGPYEQKLSAALFLTEMIRCGAEEVKSEIGNDECIGELCAMLSCYNEGELLSFAFAMKELLDLNLIGYKQMICANMTPDDLASVLQAQEPGSNVAMYLEALMQILSS